MWFKVKPNNIYAKHVLEDCMPTASETFIKALCTDAGFNCERSLGLVILSECWAHTGQPYDDLFDYTNEDSPDAPTIEISLVLRGAKVK